MRYNVFISCKKEDYELAIPVYEYLTRLGLKVFLACAELSKLGQSAYGDAIDDVLSRSEHMIVVASQINHIKSKWVRFEWGTFCDDFQSDYRDGNLILLLTNNVIVTANQLPSRIRHKQFFPLSEYDKVIDYVNSRARIPYADVVDTSYQPSKIDSSVELALTGTHRTSALSLPQRIQIPLSDKKLYMVLSPNKDYYIGNITASANDWSWIKDGENKILESFVDFANIVISFSFFPLLNLIKRMWNEITNTAVNDDLCKILSKSTGINFAVPHESELNLVTDEQKQHCIVLRVKDNIDVLTKVLNK